MNVHSGQFIIICQSVVRLDDEIFLVVAVDGSTGYFDVRPIGRSKTVVHLAHLNHVIYRHRIKDCFYIMISVRSYPDDIQTKINLCTRFGYHLSKKLFCAKLIFSVLIWVECKIFFVILCAKEKQLCLKKITRDRGNPSNPHLLIILTDICNRKHWI